MITNKENEGRGTRGGAEGGRARNPATAADADGPRLSLEVKAQLLRMMQKQTWWKLICHRK